LVYRLRNQSDPEYILNITSDTWYRILDLAESYGWNPSSALSNDHYGDPSFALAGTFLGIPLGGYEHRSNGHGNGNDSGKLVMLEDALNLADALDQAFMEYEPARVPASFFLFAPENPKQDLPPAIGTLSLLIDFCRSGAFWIEDYHRSIS
jgi:hypothetical protein